MAKPGPKPRVWTDEERALVRKMALAAIPQVDIAKRIHTTAETLEKYFREELNEGGDKADAAVAGALFKNAMSGNVTAQIFWMKTRRRWKEFSDIEMSGKNGGDLIVRVVHTEKGKRAD